MNRLAAGLLLLVSTLAQAAPNELEARLRRAEPPLPKEVLARILAPTPDKDWRSTLGMFTGDPVMREIDEEGLKIREAEREEARRDHS